MDEIVAKYRVDVNEAVKNLNKLQSETKQLDKELDKAGKDGTKALDSVGKEASTLETGFKKLGGIIAAAFAIDRIIALGKEMVMLAAKSEGVERAFKRIGSPQILQGLRDATRGTVSDLVLMQNAVKASNFKIPLENLASLFKFAQARARETGESVDYLVDSIILGIGRKSPLILDNLGISAIALREKLNGVGTETASVGDIAQAVGDIATEELSKMGDQADTTADKIAQLSVVWENLKVSIGNAIIEQLTELQVEFTETGAELGKLNEDLDGFNIISFMSKNALNALAEPFTKLNELVLKGVKATNFLKDGMIGLKDATFAAAYRLTLNNEELIEFLKLSSTAKKLIVEQWMGFKDYADFAEDAARATELFNKATLGLVEDGGKVEEYIRSLNQLNTEMKDLDAQLKAAVIGSTEFWNVLDRIDKKTKEVNDAVAMTKLYDAFKIDEELAIDIDVSGLMKYPEEVKKTTDLADEMWQAHFAELMRLQDEAFENDRKNKERELEEWNTYSSTVGSLIQSISSIQNTVTNSELATLENALAQGQITREEYDKKRKAILEQQAEDQKQAALFQATIDGISAVVNAYSEGGAILAAIVGAAVALEIAAIAAAPIPQFKDGGLVREHGLLKGKSHAQGGIVVEAEGNEYFMPTKQTSKNFGLLEAMRKGIEEQYIMKHYVPRMIDASLFKGMNDIGNSAQLNGLTANLKDVNIIAAMDRNRIATMKGFHFLAKELKIKNTNQRGNYRA